MAEEEVTEETQPEEAEEMAAPEEPSEEATPEEAPEEPTEPANSPLHGEDDFDPLEAGRATAERNATAETEAE